MSLLICIPHVPERGAALANCVRSLERWTSDYNISIVHDARSAGEGWNRCAEQGLRWWPDTTHIWFGNDDVAVAPHWSLPLIEAADKGYIPGSRIEPAGGHIEEEIFQDHPPMPPETYPVPRDKMAYFYADLARNQPIADWASIDHTSFPFCTVDQWRYLGPFPPIHYGTDAFFCRRARRLGSQVVARLDSVVFNYNVNIGRHRNGWTEQDFLDYDGVFALPKYESGEWAVTDPPLGRETIPMLTKVRAWRKQHLRMQAEGY